MTNKHTAGEWFISNHNNELKVRARNTMMGTICTLNDIFEHEAEANAKLIAAVVPFFDYVCNKANNGCNDAISILNKNGYAKGKDY